MDTPWAPVERCILLTAAIVLSLASWSSTAAGYPDRPVRLIVPFPPSGGTDIVARLVSRSLAEKFRQQFVIDNRPGAASTMGAAIAARANPDGYTLLFVTASFAIAEGYYKHLPYDTRNDFAPVSLLASGPLLVVVHPSVQANSVRELIALAKRTPNTLNYASGGAGGINHLAGELFNSLAGTRLVHVAYKGAGPALSALIAGEVQVMIATLGSALPQVRSGKLKALASCGERRATVLPDLPTLAEAGVAGYAADNWYGLLAPRGTDVRIANALNAEISSALADQATREQLLKLGFEAATSTPTGFREYLSREIAKWAHVIDRAGLRLESTP
jgi:tripartite-type tricarboxylate transporter receptor subunit TctC